LFGEAVGPDDVEVFPFELAGKSVLAPHLHTSDLAAWVTEGRMAFGFGEGFAERIELGPGDVIWLQAREAHAEEVVGNERATMVVAYVKRFETEPA
jgi:Cupin domain.